MIKPLHLALYLGLGSAPAAAEAPAQSEASAQDTALAEAQALFKSGRAKYEMGNYDGAIADWTESFAIVTEHPNTTEVQDALVYNVTKAQRAAYQIDGDVKRLKLAKQLLERSKDYRERTGDSAEVAQLDAEILALDEQIAKHESGSPPPPPQEGEPADEPKDVPRGRGLMIGGIASLGVGAVGLGLMTGGMLMGNKAQQDGEDPEVGVEERQDAISRGQTGNVLAISGAVVGTLGVAAGTALIVLAVKKNKSADDVARTLPLFGVNSQGVSLGLKGSF